MMTKAKILLLIIAFLSIGGEVHSQKIIAEGTIAYNMAISTGNSGPQSDALKGASTTIFLKGNNSRADMISPLGKEITIFNSKSNNAVILKEFSGQRLMITLSRDNWKEKNKMYSDVNFDLTNEYKTIEGFNTRKAIAKMPDGKTFDVYYSPDIIAVNKEYDATFSKLPGLPIQYEIESGKMKFRYTISKINYDPVPISQFDFPSTGYRIMTYEENQSLKKGN